MPDRSLRRKLFGLIATSTLALSLFTLAQVDDRPATEMDTRSMTLGVGSSTLPPEESSTTSDSGRAEAGGVALQGDTIPPPFPPPPTDLTPPTVDRSADHDGTEARDQDRAPTTTDPGTDTEQSAPSAPKVETTTTPAAPEVETSGPIRLAGESGVVLEGLEVSSEDGPCVVVGNSRDITIRNSSIGPCDGPAVLVEGSTSVRLEGLEISDSASGVYALESQGVAVIGNRFRNAGRNFVQFDKVTGGGNRIVGNAGANRLGASSAEDFVSIYRSSGTSSNPLLVSGNKFRDGGPSQSGSGIMVGDYGGSNIVVEGNSLVNPGQVGIGVPGGTNIKVVGNSVFSAPQPWSNVGIYVWNQSGGSCGEIEVRGNRVEWYDAEGSLNPSWDAGNCGTVDGWDENDWSADLG